MKATPDENEDADDEAEGDEQPHPLESGIDDAREGNTSSLDDMLSKLD